jgi:hypothetical protein
MPTTSIYLRSACIARQSVDGGNRASSAVRLLHVLVVAISAYFCFGHRLFAQTSDSRTAEQPYQSWTATTESHSENQNPTRIIESHIQNGNRTQDERSLQIRGSDGHFVPYQDIEKETRQVDTSTVRTTTRTFGRDADGKKTLLQLTEEERYTLPDGDSNGLRITSNPDVNGRLQPVQREFVETKRIGMDVEETRTTVMLPSVTGDLAPVLKTHELRRQVASNTIETQKTTLLSDGPGNWQVSEIRQSTIRQEANHRSTEERIFRRDAEGQLTEVSHVVTMESESASGEKRNLVETYSVDVPGTTRDGGLHLVERATTVQRTSATEEQITKQEVEQIHPGDPDSGLRVSILINNTVRPGPSGEEATRTIRVRDSNGSIGVISVDTTKSDRVTTIQVQQTPSEKPN